MKKIFIGLAGGLLILLIGLFVWAKNYQSYTSVEKRFENALASADVDELSKLMIRQDEQSLNIYETEAFLDLYYEVIAINELKTVYDIVEHGKFLGVFKAHKVQVIDQYVLYNNYFEELSFVFNDIIPEAEIEDNTVVYGPMTPGIYTVKATFDSQYGLMNVEDSIMLMNPFEEPIRLGMDIPIGQVSFYIENYEQIDIEKTQIFVHDYMIPLSDYKVENIGPLIIDGSQTVQIVTDMPWGEVLSEEVAINDTHLYLNADTITEEQFDTVLHHLVEFGEQYVEALANQQIDVITTASRDVKKMIDDDINRNRYFSGKFKRVELDNVYTTVLNEGENLSVLAKYVFESGFHALEESPELREDSIFWRMELGYDQSLGQWLIEDLSRSSTWSFTMTHEKEGSGELKGPSEDVINQAKKEQLYLEMNDFIEDYIKAEVKAINGRDMKYITDYVTENDTYKKELSDYIEYVDAEELVEEVYMTKVDNIEEKSKDEWHVTIIKEYELNWPDTYEVKKDQTVLKVIETNEQFFVDDIITSDEL